MKIEVIGLSWDLSIACALGSVYGFLQGAWPFGIVEAIWAMIAFKRWMKAKQLK